MSRRSSRLVSGGYYNSDEESDSSSVTNISYRENPVKVFKKKAGARKPGSRTPSRAKSNASAAGAESDVTVGQYEGLSTSSPSSSETQPTMRTVPYISPIATPRPALTPISARGQTPTRCPSAPPEKSPYTGLCSSGRPGLHLRPLHKQPSQSGVDSSGYSSSEGNQRIPPTAAAGTSRIHGGGGAGGAGAPGYTAVISSAFFSLLDTISVKAAAAQSRVMHLTALANNSFSGHVKKAAGLFLLLLLLLLCLWFLLPWLTSLFSRATVTKTQSRSVASSTPAPQPVTAPPPTPVVDPAVVSAVVDAKLQRFMDELQLKQENFLSQRRDRLQLDLQNLKDKLQAVDSDNRLRLEQEVAGLGKRMANHQTDSLSAVAGLNLKIQALEAQNAKLSQELSSIQLLPPPAPCPDPSVAAPVLNHLTPELQEAMEKWLSDRIKEQDLIRFGDKGGSSDCRRPMADKMADFALETQGASVISTRCSETYRIRSACVTLFGFPLWYPSESPRTVIQGYPVLLPGKCWAFHGVQGTLVISLSHPVTITHVTVDHLPRCNSPTGHIDSAPKDFEVYGMKNDTEEGKLLGTFTYDEDGESTQTFELLNPGDEVYRVVELRVLSNWGHVEYTCLYRFRVHGRIAAT